MNSSRIILYPSNWLYNAGVVGFLRVLEFGKKRRTFQFNEDGSIEIKISSFDNFETIYFEYVSKLYLLQKFNMRELTNFIGRNLDNTLTAEIKNIENEIRNSILALKADEGWTTFIKEVEEIKIALNHKIKGIHEKLKKLNINEKDREKIEKISDNMCKNFSDICTSISEFKAQAAFLGSFYFNKDVVANPKNKRLERPQDFRKKYLDPIFNGKNGDNLCILCGKGYSEESISELSEGDFSILGISSSNFSNFYNYYTKDGISYNRKCSLCQFILLCAFAGFNLKPFQLRELDETDYIFVNYPSFEEAFWVNNRIQEEFKKYQFGIFTEKINTYLKSLELILSLAKKKTRWLLENTYFAEIKISMRKDQTKPKFVYLSIDKVFAEVFSEFNELGLLLKNLSFSYEVYKNNSVYLSTEILKRLIEKKPLIYIAFKMLSEKLSEKNNNISPVWSLISLEFLINQKRRSNMSAKKLYGILKNIQEAGKTSFLVDEIDKEKRFHMAQRFLTLIRGARKEDFYNELLRLFVVYKKPVPENLFSLLPESEEITFQEKALAFLTGFINPLERETSETNNKKEVNNE